VVVPLTENNKVGVGVEVEVTVMMITANHNDNRQPSLGETLLNYKAKSSTAATINKQTHS
jgi:hypothetical protein